MLTLLTLNASHNIKSLNKNTSGVLMRVQ